MADRRLRRSANLPCFGTTQASAHTKPAGTSSIPVRPSTAPPTPLLYELRIVTVFEGTWDLQYAATGLELRSARGSGDASSFVIRGVDGSSEASFCGKVSFGLVVVENTLAIFLRWSKVRF